MKGIKAMTTTDTHLEKRRRGRPKGTAHVQVDLGPPRMFAPAEIIHLRRQLASQAAATPGAIFSSKKPASSMSQGEFAKILGTTPAAVSGWERGESEPSGPARRLMELLRALGPMTEAVFATVKQGWQMRPAPENEFVERRSSKTRKERLYLRDQKSPWSRSSQKSETGSGVAHGPATKTGSGDTAKVQIRRSPMKSQG